MPEQTDEERAMALGVEVMDHTRTSDHSVSWSLDEGTAACSAPGCGWHRPE